MAGCIMVIDDDPALLGFTSKYLSRLGYIVEPHHSAEEAWERFNAPESDYSVVVVDLSLRGIPGPQLSQMMLDANPAVRLILTSGYPFDTQKLSEFGRGRMAFLHKPFTPAMLTETVDRMVRLLPASNAD